MFKGLLVAIALAAMQLESFALAAEADASEKKFIEAVEGELENVPSQPAEQSSQKQKKVLLRKKAVVPEAALAPQAGSDESDEATTTHRGIRNRHPIIPDRNYGQYKLRFGLMKPKFDGDQKFYKELYGNTKWHPEVSVDWLPWDGPIGLGVGLHFGYYQDDGYGVTGEPDADGNIVVDKNQETRFRMYPVKAVLAAQFTPFTEKWLGIDGWIGYEHLMYSETRLSGKKTPSNDLYVNSGSVKNYTYGGAVNLCINMFDEHSAAVLRRGMGIGYVYLSYIYEVSQPIGEDSSGPNLSRISQGGALSFETAL